MDRLFLGRMDFLIKNPLDLIDHRFLKLQLCKFELQFYFVSFLEVRWMLLL